MNVLWLTWKDYFHPEKGGAEVVLRELSQRLVADGHQVTYLTVGYPGAPRHEQRDGIEFIRVGQNRYLHSFQALAYYVRHLRGKFDVLIEVVNTAPYFGVLFGGAAKRFVFYHQLAREVWFHETKPPLSHLGYFVLEPLATRLLAWAGVPLITVSNSSMRDLARYGFRPTNTHLISEGLEIEPVADVAKVRKFRKPTILSFGAIRGMKRTLDQIKAFELAKPQLPNLRLLLAGDASGEYGGQVLDYAQRSPYGRDILFERRPSRERKVELMRRAHVLTFTSVKEGWGLVATEAASQGTPAVVYDVDGLRDSVRHNETGLVCEPTPAALATGITQLLQDRNLYRRFQRNAWEFSQQCSFDRSYQDLMQALGEVQDETVIPTARRSTAR